jgi:hypothetical protein
MRGALAVAAMLLASQAAAGVVSHRLNTLNLAGERATSARLEEGELRAETPSGRFGGEALVGAHIEGERPDGRSALHRVVRAVRDARSGGSTWLYELEYRDADSRAWKPFCAPDAEGGRWAIPLAGYYDTRNAAHADPARITFACTRGVMAKCYRWGYYPWQGPEHAAAHQACIRMAMADYCGDGRSWTRDGTLIQRWDALTPPVQPYVGIAKGMRFEAAWTPQGAACLARARWVEKGFGRDACAASVPACASPEEALRKFGGSVLLLNASAEQQ